MNHLVRTSLRTYSWAEPFLQYLLETPTVRSPGGAAGEAGGEDLAVEFCGCHAALGRLAVGAGWGVDGAHCDSLLRRQVPVVVRAPRISWGSGSGGR